uniref:Peptidase S1 domain-containing protein n=1 Tax=Anopheles atroparvus TaxID=41427 RepID=A0A182J6A6_ANOAO
LRQGLQNYQLCAGDIKMDTCPGDSGGPLQIRLLNSIEMTPFIVGVTSFGSACGQSEPGVYMKVSSYIPWIRSELAKRREKIEEWSFKPYECAQRYNYLRELEDDVKLGIVDSFESYDFDNSHMNYIESTQTVNIQWAVDQKVPSDCYGVVIDEDTVLTLASCAVFERMRASHVVHNDKRNDVVHVHRHPMYASGSFYNDIAVLKTKDRFKFSCDFVPACIWKPQIVQLSPRADIQSGENCTVPDDYLSGLSRGLTQEHLCFGNKPFLVPESCQMKSGAPIRRNIWRMNRHFEHFYGLNLLGKDCGFGRSAVATRIGYHIDWLNSVLLPNYRDKSESVHFLDNDLVELDHCTGIDGNEDHKFRFVESSPKYNSDCQRYLDEHVKEKLSSTEFCTDVDSTDDDLVIGEPVVWYRPNKADNTTTQYLVGIVSHTSAEHQLAVNVRVSSYHDWIKSLI